MPSLELSLAIGSFLVILSIASGYASGRLGIPSLLLFLAIGMLVGSDGPGGIEFDNPHLVQSIGVVALALILFAGGLDTQWHSVRPVLWRGISLSTVGVCVTALLVGWFASAVLNFAFLQGLLLGAIVSSTDAAAVFAILRAKHIQLKGDLTPLLELESGSNDPMAVILTIGLIELLTQPSTSALDLLRMFAVQVTLGAGLGVIMGKVMGYLLDRFELEFQGLYPVLSVALALFTYGITSGLGGSGFLAVYLAGLLVGRRSFARKADVMRFHDGVAWLMQITMFLVLGLQVFPSRLVPLMVPALLLSLFLIVIARPASIFLGLLPTRMPVRERALVAWVGLRGAVPIILATFPLVAGIPRADEMFHLVFFIVLTSLLLQGPSVSLVARWLGVEGTPVAPAKTSEVAGPSSQ